MPIKTVKSKLFEELVAELKVRETLDVTKRDATNAFNRHNTKCGKTFAAFYQEENFPAGTVVSIEGTEYMWAVTEGRAIDPKRWYQLWQDGEITEAQFFQCLAVGKQEAKIIIGEDQVEMLSIDIRGTKADIRRDDSKAGSSKGNHVILPEPIAKPVGIKPRPGIATPVQAPAQKRRINVGK